MVMKIKVKLKSIKKFRIAKSGILDNENLNKFNNTQKSDLIQMIIKTRFRNA